MLEELKNYNNLGTITFFSELLSLFLKKDSWKITDLKAHFYNRVIDGQYIFDGGVPFLVQLGVLVEANKSISINPGHSGVCSLNPELLKKYLIEIMLNSNVFEDYFIHIFSPGFITIDSQEGFILINNNAFDLKYSNLKHLLINLGFIKKPIGFDFGNYILSDAYRNLIIKNGLPRKAKRMVDLQKFEEQLEANELYGREAEEFVLLYERNRLGEDKKIVHISEINVCAGFDILSFHTNSDILPQRLIEVKSYAGKPYFYWSKNELEKAREAQDNYFIYLVDRDQIQNQDYIPLIIENPYRNIFKSNNWIKDVESYFISKI